MLIYCGQLELVSKTVRHALIFSDLHLHQWESWSTPTEEGPSRVVDQFNTLRQIYDYAIKNGITEIYFLGDFFHSRKALETSLLSMALNFLSHLFQEAETLRLYMIAGNHDFTGDGKCFLSSIFRQYPKVTVCETSTSLSSIAFLPWGTQLERFPEARIALGHIEVQGAWYNEIMQEKKGVSVQSLLDRYELVFLGHYHMHQVITKDRIVVVGSTNRLTRGDQGVPKGFLDVDLDSGFWEFIPLETFDFPDLEKPTKRNKQSVSTSTVRNVISFEEALRVWLEKAGRVDLLNRAMKYWNEAIR